jgi:hypothetical protein
LISVLPIGNKNLGLTLASGTGRVVPYGLSERSRHAADRVLL